MDNCQSHGRPKDPTPKIFESQLIKFINILRHLGLRVSLAETLDAMKALELVDLMNPREVKSALKTTLVKSAQDKPAFDRAFAAFFVPPEEKEERIGQKQAAQEEEDQEIAQAGEELVFEEEFKPLNLTDEQKLTYSRLPQDLKDKLKKLINEDFRRNPVNSNFNLLESVVRGHLNFWKKQLQDQIDFSPLDRPDTGDATMDDVLEEVRTGLEQAEEQILYEDMKDIADQDLTRVNLLIRKLAKKLAAGISRRYKRTKKKKRLDLRRSIRHNIRFGGTLLQLKYRSKKIQRPKLVLICDVSASMARYAGFVIQFIYGLSSVVENIESFVFAERLERVSPYFEESGDFEETMARIMNTSLEWGRGTNLGNSLGELMGKHKKAIATDSFIIIVSDSKTMAVEQAAQKVAELRGQVKDILWLNTIPKKEWASLNSVTLFSRHSRMFECYTLAHLEKIIRTNLWT